MQHWKTTSIIIISIANSHLSWSTFNCSNLCIIGMHIVTITECICSSRSGISSWINDFLMIFQHFVNCSDYFRRLSVVPVEWVEHSSIYFIFDFHLLSIAQTMIPFVVLLILNINIVWRLTQDKRVNRYLFMFNIIYILANN